MSNKILWSKVKRNVWAHEHVKVWIDGEADLALCKICSEYVPIEVPGRKRESVLLEFTRIHYYRHKLYNPNLLTAEPADTERTLWPNLK